MGGLQFAAHPPDMNHHNALADALREQPRHSDGRFGEKMHAEAPLDLADVTTHPYADLDPLDENNKADYRVDTDNLVWDWNEKIGAWRLRHGFAGPIDVPYLTNLDHIRGPLRLPTREEREENERRARHREERRARWAAKQEEQKQAQQHLERLEREAAVKDIRASLKDVPADDPRHAAARSATNNVALSLNMDEIELAGAAQLWLDSYESILNEPA